MTDKLLFLCGYRYCRFYAAAVKVPHASQVIRAHRGKEQTMNVWFLPLKQKGDICPLLFQIDYPN